MAKSPTDTELKTRFAVPNSRPLDQLNLKKFKKLQAKVIETAKEVRELLPDDNKAKNPILKSLDGVMLAGFTVFADRSSTEEAPKPAKTPKAATPKATKVEEPKAPVVTLPETPAAPAADTPPADAPPVG